jgi:Aflatoxin regulatory protein.
MEVAAEPELQYVGDPLALPGGFLDAEIPLSSIHNLLGNSQLNFNSFAFSNFASRELSPKRQMGTSSSTDNLFDDSAPSLITEDNSISPIPEATYPQEDRLCQNPQGYCISLATGVLRSMNAGSRSSCILGMSDQSGGGGRQPQVLHAADAILSMNQSALQAVRSILKCSCYGSPQVLLIVTVICSEIMAWYWHVVDIYSLRRRNSTADNAVLLPTSVGSKVETRRRDFFIGNHRLGQHVETALIRQVLSGMLQELQVVLGDIACHAGHLSAIHERRSDLMLSGVRARMVAFLHTQLRALTAALDHSDSDLGTMVPPFSHN